MDNNFYHYNNKKTVKCPFCQDRGWIYSRTDGIYEYYRMCQCHPLFGKERIHSANREGVYDG